MWRVKLGDALDVLKTLDDSSVDSVVTDPPYGLEFMGKAWDKYTPGDFQNWCEQWARECLRVLKPGGHLVAFGGTRTYHRLAAGVEDAGFEIRDSLHWIYGSGFPKSLDVSKAIDKAAGVEFSSKPASGVGFMGPDGPGGYNVTKNPLTREGESTEAAKEWAGWGTALKPAHEPIVLARKPLAEKTVAKNVLEYGTGGLNIDGSRVECEARPLIEMNRRKMNGSAVYEGSKDGSITGAKAAGTTTEGRFPPNILLSGDAAEEMDRQSGMLKGQVGMTKHASGSNKVFGKFNRTEMSTSNAWTADSGGASRFFPIFKYQAKAAKKERPVAEGVAAHPTVKPVALMQWLVNLVTPPGGTVLDPFAGTGTTAEACVLECFNCILIEREPDYVKLINARMAKHINDLFEEEMPA